MFLKYDLFNVMQSWIFSIITPVFIVTWSSEIILICWFETFVFLLVLKTVVLLHIGNVWNMWKICDTFIFLFFLLTRNVWTVVYCIPCTDHIHLTYISSAMNAPKLVSNMPICVCVCVCVCGCVGMFMWFMRTQICIMTWVWHRYYKEKVIYEDIFSVPII